MKKQTQQGSGSAENKQEDRGEQVNRSTSLSDQEKQEIAAQIETDPNRIGTVEETGMMSGRDEHAGGSGDNMEAEGTGKPTDR